MPYLNKSRAELIVICKENRIKGYSGKNKNELVKLLQNTTTTVMINVYNPATNIPVPTPAVNSQIKSIDALLNSVLEIYSIKETATKLNLATGTINRWLELKHIPPQYTFDLSRILSKSINYQEYKSNEKDQFFTPTHITQKCWEIFIENTSIDCNEYTFIEPSAGDGAFLKVLPPNTIAMDIEPRHVSIISQDYLLWKPADLTKKYIVFGNPPFGLRGHIALNFILHSLQFADYVCFILPQLFESDGKGSPRKRIHGYNLIYSEKISAPFYTPENTNVDVNGVFQIWSKFESNSLYNIILPNQENIKIYSLSDGGTVASTRNKKMLDNCDAYLPSTCFGKENMRIYNSFIELPGQKGYGIVFLKNRDLMMEKCGSIDWAEVAFLSTNSAYNLRTSLILNKLG